MVTNDTWESGVNTRDCMNGEDVRRFERSKLAPIVSKGWESLITAAAQHCSISYSRPGPTRKAREIPRNRMDGSDEVGGDGPFPTLRDDGDSLARAARNEARTPR
ncbi:hypothetical protein VNO77_22956 [Canavalia gladiata]|uniref:Uncharacterized protein n=1 Tax=Canavalia gladiata TaxID=3824 RepID=A0AAN9L4G4_CANGL